MKTDIPEEAQKWWGEVASNSVAIPFVLVCWFGGLLCKTLAIRFIAEWFVPALNLSTTAIVGGLLIFRIVANVGGNDRDYVSRGDLVKHFFGSFVSPWITMLFAWGLHFGIR